jgi:hypothetical protein
MRTRPWWYDMIIRMFFFSASSGPRTDDKVTKESEKFHVLKLW